MDSFKFYSFKFTWSVIGLSILCNPLIAQNVDIPDYQFKDYLLNNPSINTTADGEISFAEAAAFTGEIDVNSLYIFDLTGIEAFTSITRLNCSNNWLSTLNVSQNVNLKSLSCSGVGLDSLDISNLPDLTYLDCSGNSLSNLDFSNNLNIDTLNCNWNELESLDASALVNLTYLDCGSNYQLSSFNISANVALETLICSSMGGQLDTLDTSANINLKYLNCRSNGLDSLNVTNNSLLVELICDFNQLTHLDVTHNPLLVKIDCLQNNLSNIDLSNNPELDYLDCGQNVLTELNVSENHQLRTLRCYTGLLSQIDLSNNPHLDYLDLPNHDFTQLDVSMNTELTSFRCFSNQITSLDVSNNPSLTTLVCSNNELTWLNVANGSNEYMITFAAWGNPDLDCIQVDDVSIPSWPNWEKDPTAYYSIACPPIGILEHVIGFSAYPNPSNGQFSIELNSTVDCDVQAFNMLGQSVFLKHFNSIDRVSIELPSTGIYHLVVSTDNGIFTEKVVVQ